MTIAELSPRGSSAPEFDRTPPQDVAAEQSVLGAMLLSKDAIADVVEVLRGADFYRPAHELVYAVVLDLYGRGEPADPVTVAGELTKRGEIARVGGAPYLHTLISMVPTAANAGYYADIVRERAVLRRLVEAGTRIVQMGYGGDGEVDAIVDRAQAEIYGVTDKRTSEDYVPLSAVMESTLDEIEAISSRGGELTGVPTGFADLDELTHGLHGGQMVVIAARPAVGKALALDTALPTPTGWTTMGKVSVGDQLLGADGRPTRVVAATEVMLGRPCYEVEFCDGTVIVADGQHQWVTTESRGSRSRPRASSWEAGESSPPTRRMATAVQGQAPVTTEQLARTLRGDDGTGEAPRVPLGAALQLAERALPAPPYLVGCRVGHGHAGAAAGTVAAEPGALGVPGGERIPRAYLRASQQQRRDLLAGLLDSVGTVAPDGAVRLALPSPRLAGEVAELVTSLGYRATVSTQPMDGDVGVNGRGGAGEGGYRVSFHAGDEVFRQHRKRQVHQERRLRQLHHQDDTRSVVAVRPVTSVPVRCVQVDKPDHLYLASRAMIPTHNSTLALDLARSAAIKHQLTACVFSLEMGRNEITMRLLSAEARVPLHHMRTGKMSDDDWNRLARRMGEVSSAPLFIDDSPNLTMMEIRAKCRRLKQRHDLRLVVIDYLQLMTSGKKVENRQQEVSEFSRSLKLLAKELDVPVVALSQLNRGPEQRTDKRPLLADLRESGSIEQDSDVVMLLHREDLYEKESPRAGEADIIVAKHRNGPTATITVAFQGHYSRFVDMAQ